MEHNVEYRMILEDRMSAVAEKINTKFKSINSIADRIGKNQGFNKLNVSASKLPKSISDLTLKLKDLNSQLDNTHSKQTFVNLRKEIKATEKELQSLKSGVMGSKGNDGILGSFGKKLLGFGAAYVGFQQIGSFVKGNLEAYDEAEKARAQLKAGLTSTHYRSGKNVEGLENQAIGLEGSTLFRHDETMKAQGILLTFDKIKGTIYDKAIPAIQDLTTRFGGDLAGNARIVGKALNEPVQSLMALRRMGIQFSDSQTKHIKNLVKTGHLYEAQMIILKQLNEKFGGSAIAAAQAGMGPVQQLTNKWHTLGETIGENMAPKLNSFANGFGKIVDRLRDFIKIPIADKINDEIGQIVALQGELTSANTSEERRKEILVELNKIEPSITTGITAESTDYTLLASNIQKVINKLYEKIALSNTDEQTAKNLADTKEKADQLGKDLGKGFSAIWKSIDKHIIDRPDLDDEGKLLLGAQVAHTRRGSLYRNEVTAIHGTPGHRRVDVYGEMEDELREEAKRVRENKHAIALNNIAQKAINANIAALKVAFHDTGDDENSNGKKPEGKKPKGGEDDPDPLKYLDGLTSGAKATNITINLPHGLNEKVEIHANSVSEGGKKVEDIVNEQLLRVLNSANRIATQ